MSSNKENKSKTDEGPFWWAGVTFYHRRRLRLRRSTSLSAAEKEKDAAETPPAVAAGAAKSTLPPVLYRQQREEGGATAAVAGLPYIDPDEIRTPPVLVDAANPMGPPPKKPKKVYDLGDSLELEFDYGSAISAAREDIDYFSDNDSVFKVSPITLATKLKGVDHEDEQDLEEEEQQLQEIGSTTATFQDNCKDHNEAKGATAFTRRRLKSGPPARALSRDHEVQAKEGGTGGGSSSVDSGAVIVRNREYFENLRKCYDVGGGEGGETDRAKSLEGPRREDGEVAAAVTSDKDTPARVLSVPASTAVHVKPRTSNASDAILQEMRRWQREQDARQFRHSSNRDREDHPEFAARRRNLVRSRSAIDMPDEAVVASSNKPFESHAAEDLMVIDRDDDDDIHVIGSTGGDSMSARRNRKGSDGSPGEALARLRKAMRKSRGLFRLRRLIKLLKGAETDNGKKVAMKKGLPFFYNLQPKIDLKSPKHLFPVEESRSQSELSVMDAMELGKVVSSGATTTSAEETVGATTGAEGEEIIDAVGGTKSPILSTNNPTPSLPPSPLVRSASGLTAFQQQQSVLQSVSETDKRGKAAQEESKDNSTMRNTNSSQQSQGSGCDETTASVMSASGFASSIILDTNSGLVRDQNLQPRGKRRPRKLSRFARTPVHGFSLHDGIYQLSLDDYFAADDTDNTSAEVEVISDDIPEQRRPPRLFKRIDTSMCLVVPADFRIKMEQ